MAKSIILYGVLLGTFIGFCSYVNGVGISSFQQSAISLQQSVISLQQSAISLQQSVISFQQSAISLQQSVTSFQPESEIATSAVILSGTKCSRKISPLKAVSVRPAISPLSAMNQQISPFRYAPVEKTVANGAFYGTSSEADLIRNQIKQIYTAEIGVREKTGKNDGERVEEYLAVTQLGKGYAWCAAFVSWVFAEAGLPEPRTPWSPALFPKKRVIWERGKSVLATNVEESSTKLHQSSTLALKPNTQNLTPASGDVFGIYFANLKRIAHVGFVDEWGDKQIITVEGNTDEAGSGEGDGVYRKRRPISSIYQVANWIREEVDP